MDIRANGSASSRRAPADWFTGTVWQEPVIESPAPGNVRATYVHFEPGGRTNWHTHPAGQTPGRAAPPKFNRSASWINQSLRAMSSALGTGNAPTRPEETRPPNRSSSTWTLLPVEMMFWGSGLQLG